VNDYENPWVKERDKPHKSFFLASLSYVAISPSCSPIVPQRFKPSSQSRRFGECPFQMELAGEVIIFWPREFGGEALLRSLKNQDPL
jgi:hypothetical protein